MQEEEDRKGILGCSGVSEFVKGHTYVIGAIQLFKSGPLMT